jgi:putative salt-induced outer membrane protein YdiY
VTLRPSLRLLFACSLLVLLSATALRADTVVLKNGDRLTGTAVKLEGGKLTFKTAYADAIVIAWDQVASLTTAQPMALPATKQVLSVTAVERSDAGMVVSTVSGTVTLDPKEVTVLRSVADQQAYEASLHPKWSHAWAGAASLSIALARGNSQTAAIGAGFNLARPTRTDKTSLYASFLYSQNGTPSIISANTAGGGLRYDHNLAPRIFAFGTADFFSDQLQNLSYRSLTGGGFGWHAIATPRQAFDVLGGAVLTYEVYVPGPTNTFAALDLGEQFTRKVGAGGQLNEQFFFYPDLQQTGNYQFNFNTAFSTKIGKGFTWQTAIADQYTSFPPTGAKDNDIQLTTGIGITLVRH